MGNHAILFERSNGERSATPGNVESGRGQRAYINGEAIVVFQSETGYVAAEISCPHLQRDLAAVGQLTYRDEIRCTTHSFCFDPESGECVYAPPGFRKSDYHLQVYRIVQTDTGLEAEPN